MEEAGEEGFWSELTENEITAFKEFKKRAGDLCNGRSDKFLLAFVLARKLDVDRTLELYKKHLEWREKNDVDNPDLDKIRALIMTGYSIWTTDLSDNEGRGLSYLFPHKFDYEAFDAKTNSQLTAWTLDLLCERIDNTRKGVVIIEDLGNMSFSVFKSMSKVDTKTIMADMQNCLPIRLQKIYILNPPWYLKLMVALVKPFMKKKLRQRVQVISGEELISLVPSEHLLVEAGGTLDLDWKAYLNEKLEATKEKMNK